MILPRGAAAAGADNDKIPAIAKNPANLLVYRPLECSPSGSGKVSLVRWKHRFREISLAAL